MSRTQKELRALRQQQREEAAARERARERRNLLLIVGGLAVAAAIIVGVVLFLNAQEQAKIASRLPFKAVTGTLGTQVADEGTPNHISPSETWTYKFYPATSGPHYSLQGYAPVAWQTIAPASQPLQDGQFVHNLEHGGIAILVNCSSGADCTALQDKLKKYVTDLCPVEPQFGEVKMVMTPYSKGMEGHKIALVAWHYVQFLDSYDQNAITQFYENHVDQGPEQVA